MLCVGFLAGVIFAAILIMLGTIIGESNSEGTRNKHNSDNDVCDHPPDLPDSDMGSCDREELCGQDIPLYSKGVLSDQGVINALEGIKREMRTMLSRVEMDAIDAGISSIAARIMAKEDTERGEQ